MTDREKIIRGLESCTGYCDEETGCPYYGDEESFECEERLRKDAIALLKAQEPRVMTLAELSGIYVEFKDDFFLVSLICFDLQKIIGYMQDGSCRLWSSKPSVEQREATKWDE